MQDDTKSKEYQLSPDKDSGFSRRAVIGSAITAGMSAALTTLTSAEALGQADASSSKDKHSPGTISLTLQINGQLYDLALEPRVTLLDALREYAGLTGTKKGCDHGQCGACTVLVNGERINSCLTLAVMHQHCPIITIEGLAKGNQLHPVQAAFIEHDAFQCGYCTPGQICSAVGLMHEGRAQTDDDIREGMAGNLCRCGAYPHIVTAVRSAMNRVSARSLLILDGLFRLSCPASNSAPRCYSSS